ncbi:GTP 3',8-cyclase MoaA [Cellulosilyticum sp. I15G10I2]|uniref:GTP 3',8-cyclase MoaA n=1 Tax=Cellulosilyticum sp. I15G10I2 TaxID=1892843 RepID=UPI00085C1EC2|nr:GTP 3',8-cyclase MoaA [Cellulosilyticum sp. I15G10I2]
MKDAYGRTINYLRLSITDLCNLRCQYCMPIEGIQKIAHEDILTLEELDEIVYAFAKLGITKVRITGGEPLARKGIVTLIEKIKRHQGIKDLALTTNGILLDTMAQTLKDAGLNRVNISLDSLDDKKYTMMTRGGKLKDVLKGIEKARKVGLTPIKLNVVLIGGFNDNEVERFVRLTQEEAIDVRFIELMPIGEVAKWSKHHFLSNEYILKVVPELVKSNALEENSPALYYQLPGAKGRVGLISPISCKFCGTCNRVRLTSEGKLKHCLHSNEEFDLKAALREERSLTDFIQYAMLHKPFEHLIEEGSLTERNMIQVGG